MEFRSSVTLGLLLAGSLGLSHATAATTTFQGTLGGDASVFTTTFTLAQNSPVLFSTDSYGGGTVNGITTAAGGFVPIISIFSATAGNLIGTDGGDATCYAGLKSDPTTKMCDDAYLTENLTAGSYIIDVTEFFNGPNGPNISNGFLESGQGNFTGPTCGSANGSFLETDIAPCVQRTSSFTLNAATPEPATLFLTLPVIAFGMWRRRRTNSRP